MELSVWSLEIKHGAFNMVPKENEFYNGYSGHPRYPSLHVEITIGDNAHQFLGYEGYCSL